MRAKVEDDPGERFRRMEGEPGYKSHWKVARNAKKVRPAYRKEVEKWLNEHQATKGRKGDAEHVEWCEVRSPKKVTLEKGRYSIED